MGSRTLKFRLFVATVLLAAAVPTALAQDENGGLLIEVRAAESARPLADVAISIAGRDGSAFEGVTGADGRVDFDDIVPGLYAVTAALDGRVTAGEPSVRVSRRKTTPLTMELLLLEGPLEEIVVVARGRVADPFGPVSNSFFNREELRSAVGAGSDVMRALDGLPGLVSTGDFANFSVRGRGPRDNLIFVDGLPFGRVVHFDQTLGEEEDIGGGGRFSIFAPNSIAGAEFSPGGWSAAYGGRSGSLLQLEVAGGNPTPSASLRVDIAGVEVGYEGPSGIHDGTTTFFSARSFDFGRVFEFIEEDDIGQPELTDIVLKTVTELDARNTIEFLGILAPEEYERDIDNVLASPDFEDTSLIETEQDLALVGISWKRLVGSSAEWTNRVYFKESDKSSSEGEAYPDLVPEGTPATEIPVRSRLLTVGEAETEIGWRSDYTVRNRFGELHAGVRAWQIDADYFVSLREEWDRFVYRTSDPRPPGQQYITLLPDELNSVYEQRETSYAAYGEQIVEFDSWDLRAGLRYDRDGFSNESLVSPRLAANWRPSPGRHFSATAGIYYQSPRFLVRSASPDNFDIRNERITHVSIGYEQQFGENWTLLVEPYYQLLDNLILAEGRASGRVNNAGEGENYGVDVVLSRRFRNGWFANIVYAYNDARVDANDGLAEYDADFNRPHFFSVGGSWEISDRWKLGARWKWARGRPTDDFIIHEDVLGPGEPLRYSKELTRTNALRLEDYHSLNIRIDFRQPIGWVDLIAFIDVINVYGGPGANSLNFDPRNGINVVEENEAFPIFGLIFERAW